jgi:hypothetical protein
MGKKRGVHVVGVKRIFEAPNFFTITFKRSKCRYARVHKAHTIAKDELDAYMVVKQGANQ